MIHIESMYTNATLEANIADASVAAINFSPKIYR